MAKPNTQTPRNARIDLRVNPSEKALLELAASSQGKNLSEFVISASTEAAQLALADQSRFVLPEDAMHRFMAELEAEPRAVSAVRALLQRESAFE